MRTEVRKLADPIGAALVALAVLHVSGCGGEPAWRIVFRVAADRDASRVVEARAREGGCDGAVVFETTISRDAAGMPAPSLGPGVYGFEALALDARCNVIAQACSLVTIPTSSSVVLELASTTPVAQCEANACTDGHCSASVPDAGAMDAWTAPEDAPAPDAERDADRLDGGIDASADDAAVEPDAALDAYVGPDAALPAPPHVLMPWNGVGTGTWHAVLPDVADPPLRPEARWEESPGARSYVLELVACAEHDLSVCDFTTPDARQVVDDATLRTRPALDLGVDEVTPGGRRYALRVGACATLTGTMCAYSEPRYVDVGRHPQDIDGDGTDELVVTRNTTVEGHRGIGSSPSAVLPIVSGTTLGAVAYAGDYDADGRGDVAIDVGGPTSRWELRGGDGTLIGGEDGTDAAELLGHVLAGAGDVDGDGYADVAVVAPGLREVRVYFGGASFDAARRVVIGGDGGLETLGVDLATVGDRDGDGLADLAIGSRVSLGMGRVEIFSLAGRVARRIDSLDVMTGETDPSTQPGVLSLAGGHDLDGDAHPDILIGLWPRNVVVVWLGDGTTGEFTDPGETGRSVSIGDLAGDGLSRGIIGSPRHAGVTGETGYFGHMSYFGGPFVTWISILNREGWGHLVCAADLDADGRDDMFTLGTSGLVGYTGRFSMGMVGAGTSFRFLGGNPARYLARW